MKQPVVLKSNPHGMNLILNPDIPFEQLLEELLKKFKDSDKFFKNARIVLSYEGRVLSQDEEFAVLDLISQNTGIEIVCILDNDAERENACLNCIDRFDETTAGKTGEFYRGTLRSGQVIECETSMIVLGDVNPGAKIIAKGNIVVLGSLRGNAFAGAAGDEHAFVAALDMDPLQIRIANIMGRSADHGAFLAIKNRKRTLEPQVAIISQEAILIEPITHGLLNNIS